MRRTPGPRRPERRPLSDGSEQSIPRRPRLKNASLCGIGCAAGMRNRRSVTVDRARPSRRRAGPRRRRHDRDRHGAVVRRHAPAAGRRLAWRDPRQGRRRRGRQALCGAGAWRHLRGRRLLALTGARRQTAARTRPIAKQQGGHVARVVHARLAERTAPKPFRYRDWGTLAVIGRSRAVATFGRLHLTGTLAWLAWALIHRGC